MTTAPFAMILVALAGLFVFGGFFALVVFLVVRSDPAADSRPVHGASEGPPE